MDSFKQKPAYPQKSKTHEGLSKLRYKALE